MPRNRVIYQSEAVYVGSAFSSVASHISKVQSCNYNFSIERTDVNQFGELGAIDRLIMQEPTVNVDLTYLLDAASVSNETSMGLSTAGDNALSAMMTTTDDVSRNIAIATSAPGTDIAGDGAISNVIAIGNAFLTSWSLEASVGGYPTVTCAFEGQNIVFGSNGFQASFNAAGGLYATTTLTEPSNFVAGPGAVPAIKPGDVSVSFSNGAPGAGVSVSDWKVQSATIALTMSREPIRKLGSRLAFSRELTFPITCTFSINAVVGDAAVNNLSNLFATATGDSSTTNCIINLAGFNAANTTPSYRSFTLKKAKLNSQNITSSIGPNKMVTLEMSAQIGKDSGLNMSTIS